MLLLQLAWRNLGRSRRRTALTLAAAVFATLLMILNLAVSAGSQKRWIANAVELYPGHFQVSARGYRDTRSLDDALVLSDAQRAALDGLPGAEGWAPRLEAFGLASADADRATGRGVQLLGIDAARESKLSRLLRGMREGRAPARGGVREIALGDQLARNLGAKLGDTVIVVSADAFGSQTADRFHVVGEFHLGASELDGFAAIVDLAELQDFLGVGGGLSHVAVFAPEPRAQTQIEASLAAAFPADRYEVLGWPQLVPELVQFFRIKDIGDWLKNGLLLIVVAFGLLNTILMSVFERVREFGVLRAVGMRPRAICGLVVAESLMLSLLGIGLGFGLGIPLVLFLERHAIPLTGAEMRASLAVFGLEPVLEFALSRSALVALPLVLVAVGLVAAFLPALRAGRSRPVDALRET
ncbi:MAG TPA: FtsX-like permease family protein [Myxococcota bacterium]|nr:FtsX-like permease family protein [Myxococcota bacterium]